jgi:hypothetical protein
VLGGSVRWVWRRVGGEVVRWCSGVWGVRFSWGFRVWVGGGAGVTYVDMTGAMGEGQKKKKRIYGDGDVLQCVWV